MQQPMEIHKTEMTPEISIIVPVYNMERYLRECLDSIKGQTFTDWECIIIDDGSTDNSGSICDEYARADYRFKVIHTPNGGVATARNRGLKEVCGRFIGFVDPDDYCHAKMYETLHELITKHEADVAVISYTYVFKTFKRTKRFVKQTETMDSMAVATELIVGHRLPNYLCTKLFRREVINCTFPDGKVFEDMYVMAEWARNIKKLVISPLSLYYYRRLRKSITNYGCLSFRLDHLSAGRNMINKIKEFYPASASDKRITCQLWTLLINTSKTLARSISSIDEAEAAVISILEKNRDIAMMSRSDLGMKKRFRAKLLLQKPRTFIRLMKITHALDLHARYVKSQMFD